MKLAEALMHRADLNTRLTAVGDRAAEAATHQEGLDPVEDAQALVTETDRIAAQLEELIVKINITNLATRVTDDLTMTAALAKRDVLRKRQLLRRRVADSGVPQQAFSRSEIRIVSAVDVKALRAEHDQLARELRELDARIQATNWAADLME